MKKTIGLLLILLLVCGTASALTVDQLPSPVNFNLNVAAPDFTMTGVGGITIPSSDYAGKDLLLVYGRITCGNTVSFVSGISSALDLLAANNVSVLVGLSEEPDDESLTQFSNKYGGVRCAKTVPKGGLWTNLQAAGCTGSSITYPAVFLRSRDGKLRYYSTGYVTNPLAVVSGAVWMANNPGGTPPDNTVTVDETTFPDAKFREYVLQSFDLDGDKKLSQKEYEKVETIDCSEMGIGSLKGIEYFPGLTWLECDSNSITSLDVHMLPMLSRLECRNNSIKSLDVSGNTQLWYIDCTNNQLTDLDVSKNSALKYLDCGKNKLTALDISSNLLLAGLTCNGNSLSALDVTKNTAMTTLHCSENSLSALDLTKNSSLVILGCYSNNLPFVDVSANKSLTSLECHSNRAEITLDDQSRFTLSRLAGFDPARASGWSGGTVEGGVLTTSGNTVSFTYDCGQGKSEKFTWDIKRPAQTDPEEPDSEYGYVTTVMDGVNFRREPKITGELICQIPKGAVLPCVGPSVTGGGYTWYNVRYDGQNGYIRGDTVRLSDADGNLYGYVVMVMDGVNFRREPKSTGTVICQIPKGTVLPCIGPNVTGSGHNWYHVEYQGERGYFWMNYARPCDANGNPFGYVLVTNGGTNLRRKPEAAGEVICQIDRGTVLTCAGPKVTSGSDTWYHVEYGIQRGYINGAFARECDANGNPIGSDSKDLKDSKIASISDKVYTGKRIEPKIKVTYSGTTLVKDTDYTVTFTNNKSVGKAAVTIVGRGDYTGSKTAYFSIVPKAVKLSSVKAGSKKLTVTWTKGKAIDGYEIQYSTKKSFTEGATKTLVVKKASTTKKEIKKLEAKKKYYVRIRAYKKVGGTTYYSAWSKVMNARTKK